MKIDFVINSLTGGGAERVMTTLANGFSERKYNVKLITFNDNEAYLVNSKVERIRLHKGNIKNHTLRSLINLINFYWSKKNRPDVLVSFMPTTNAIAILVSKLYGLKIIVSEHNNHKANKSLKSDRIRKYLYKYADKTTVLTSYDVHYYESLGAKVKVMPNPIILPKKIKEFTNRKKNILVAGSLNRYKVKGFDSLLNLISPVLRENKDWTLTIAGSGDYGMKILKDITEKLNLNGQIIFTGFCENIQELMQDSQIYVLASQFEGLPMVLMEALSNGMACVAYDCVSGPRDLIDNGYNGILIENQNEKDMQAAINILIKDSDLRQRIAKNSPKSVNLYSLENIEKKWVELFYEIQS